MGEVPKRFHVRYSAAELQDLYLPKVGSMLVHVLYLGMIKGPAFQEEEGKYHTKML